MAESRIINPQGQVYVKDHDSCIKRILKPVRIKLREKPQEEENQRYKMDVAWMRHRDHYDFTRSRETKTKIYWHDRFNVDNINDDKKFEKLHTSMKTAVKSYRMT